MAEIAEQVYVAVALLLPGFYALYLGNRIYGLKLRIGDLEKSVWSLLLSLLILATFLWLSNTSFDALVTDPSILTNPRSLFVLFALSTIASILLALLLRFNLVAHINKLFWWKSKVLTTTETAWERLVNGSKVLIVQTSTDKYYGHLRGYGFLDGEMGIRILSQFTIRWDDETRSETYHPYAVDVFVPYEQIISVVRVK